MSVIERAKDSWARANDDNVGLLAAGVAFYAFLAMVPLLAALVLSYGLFADPEDAVRQAGAVANALPRDAAALVIEQMRSMAEGDNGKTALGLVVALGTAIYGATKGAKAVIVALNIVNDVQDRRGFVGQTKVSVLITLLLLGTMLVGLAAIALLGFVENLLPGAAPAVHVAIKWTIWLLFGAVATLSLSLIYRYGPARCRPGTRDSIVGAAIAAVLLGVGTLGFALYVANFGSYNATYGALGAVVILQLWLYLSAFVLLLGGEVAQSIDQAR